jgi:transcriptional regulator GlxA family with amidase domain
MERLTVNSQKINESILYMKKHLNNPIKVERLAELVGLSVSHFFALFKQKTGYAPIYFFINLRIEQAGYLLNNTNLTIREIAKQLGYKDPFFFSRQFKRIIGISPKHFRVAKPIQVNRKIIRRATLEQFPAANTESAD